MSNKVFNIRRRKVGGIWLLRLGRLQFSFCLCRGFNQPEKAKRVVRYIKDADVTAEPVVSVDRGELAVTLALLHGAVLRGYDHGVSDANDTNDANDANDATWWRCAAPDHLAFMDDMPTGMPDYRSYGCGPTQELAAIDYCVKHGLNIDTTVGGS